MMLTGTLVVFFPDDLILDKDLRLDMDWGRLYFTYHVTIICYPNMAYIHLVVTVLFMCSNILTMCRNSLLMYNKDTGILIVHHNPWIKLVLYL